MFVLLSIGTCMLILLGAFFIGWYVITPAVEWVLNGYQSLTLKAIEANEAARAAREQAASFQETAH